MAADALAASRSLATMVLIMWNKQVLVVHMKWFQLVVSTQYWKILENANGSGHETAAVLLPGFAINW